jgi:signal transduction histidine kinase
MGLRLKILLLFLLSAVISVVSCLLLLGAAYLLYRRGIASSLFSYMNRHIGIQPAMIILGTVLFLVIFLLLSKRTIKYIEEISKSVEEISQGNLDTKITVKTSDELGRLAVNINTMTEKLKSSMEDERNAERTKNELITSVSHDLRTPLTSILGYLGLVVNNKYRNEKELKHYADIAFKKSKRLNKLIDELFEFTRISYGGMKLNVSEISLGSLFKQLTEEFFPIFKEAGMECRLSVQKKRLPLKQMVICLHVYLKTSLQML